jgi:hypothetical protein
MRTDERYETIGRRDPKTLPMPVPRWGADPRISLNSAVARF